tara:strand:- start:3543 stop:3779 length:237 start_codon:yes stop_codon:yes gene_type:complete
MEKPNYVEDVYIDSTTTLWGGKNGEVNMETDNGTILTFNAYNLMRDIPNITRICFDEVMYEKEQMQEAYKKLAEFIVK